VVITVLADKRNLTWLLQAIMQMILMTCLTVLEEVNKTHSLQLIKRKHHKRKDSSRNNLLPRSKMMTTLLAFLKKQQKSLSKTNRGENKPLKKL